MIQSSKTNNICYTAMHDHVQEAVKSLGHAVPWDLHHLHKDINNSIINHERQQQPTKRIHVYQSNVAYHGALPPSDAMRPPVAPTIPQPKLPTNMYPPQHFQTTNRRNIQLMHVNHSDNNNPHIYSKPEDLNNSSQQIPQGQQVTSNISQPQYCIPINISSSTIQNIDTLPKQEPKKTASTGECRIKGCKEPNVSRRPYCARHSGNRLCEHEGCGKCAQGSTRFCIAHGGGRRCTFPGCDKGARDKFFCAAHGGGKRCNHPQCNKSAVGGSKFCTSHGGGKRCAVQGCDKSAQSSTLYCVKHGGGKKCSVQGCGKVARGKTLYCASHGGGVRCRLDGCNRVAVGKLQLCRIHGNKTTSGNNTSIQPHNGNRTSPPTLNAEKNQPPVDPYPIVDIGLNL